MLTVLSINTTVAQGDPSESNVRLPLHPDAEPIPVPPQALGEFEQMVLVAILHLEGEVYGVPIVEEIERRTGRSVSRAAVYVTLRRLEKRGLVSSWMSEPTPERGGKARRCVKVEPEGLAVLRESRQAMERMWGDLDPSLLEEAQP